MNRSAKDFPVVLATFNMLQHVAWNAIGEERCRSGILWVDEYGVNVERSTCEDLDKDGYGFVDLLVGDMEMSDGSIALSSDGVDEHAVLFQRGHQFGRRALFVNDVEHDDIRFDVLRHNLDGGNWLQQASQFFRMVMVGLEPSDMPLQGIDAGGGQDARLAHRASIHAAKAAYAIHESLVVGDQQ